MHNERKGQIEAWKVFRIIAEFVDGFETMADIGPSVSIFGSARIDESHPSYAIAKDLAYKISKKGMSVITGGGPGIMQAANQGAREAGGVSCGVSIDLPFEEQHNPFVDRKYKLCLRYFFVRKVLFLKYAQAYIFLPGGFGTLDELFEALTLVQTKRSEKFPIFLIGTAFWQGLMDWLKAVPLKEKFIKEEDFKTFTLTDDIDFVVSEIMKWHEAHGFCPAYDVMSLTSKK